MGNTVRTQLSEAPSVPGWIAVDASWQGTMNCPLLSTAAGALATGCHPTAAPPWFHRVWPTSWSACARAFFQWSRAQAEAEFFWGCKLQTQRQSPSTSNHLVWRGKHSCKFSKGHRSPGSTCRMGVVSTSPIDSPSPTPHMGSHQFDPKCVRRECFYVSIHVFWSLSQMILVSQSGVLPIEVFRCV